MGEATTYMEFLSIDWTLVMMLGNTLILFLLMRKFFFKPIKQMIDSREKEVLATYEAAEKEKAAAESLRLQYEHNLAGAQNEASEIVNLAYKRAQTKSDEIVREAYAKSTAMIAKADEEIELEKKKAMNEIKGEISNIAIMIASKVVEKDINETDHEKLIEQFIDGVGDAAWKE